jgi:hypothetical protein
MSLLEAECRNFASPCITGPELRLPQSREPCLYYRNCVNTLFTSIHNPALFMKLRYKRLLCEDTLYIAQISFFAAHPLYQ